MLVSLTVGNDLLPRFCLLTGAGFKVDVPSGCSVRELICRRLHVPPDYLDNRIQTILVDSATVDDPDTALVSPGMTVALSAAMPGLAGAILRKAGPYAAMREGVTYDGRNAGDAATREGSVLVKLFNVVQQELGPGLLRRGILIPGGVLDNFLCRSADTLRRGILAAQVDGEPVPPHELFNICWADREVRLSVRSSSAVEPEDG